MTSFFEMNVRGFNDRKKHAPVRHLLRNLSIPPSFGCLLETRVLEDQAARILTSTFPGWSYYTNYSHHRLGKIWFVSSPSTKTFLLHVSAQQITALIEVPNQPQFVCTAVYASNFQAERTLLWNDLRYIQAYYIATGTPWVLLASP